LKGAGRLNRLLKLVSRAEYPSAAKAAAYLTVYGAA
jgi:hypothetical protein